MCNKSLLVTILIGCITIMTTAFEIDRSYYIGRHGYNSMIDSMAFEKSPIDSGQQRVMKSSTVKPSPVTKAVSSVSTTKQPFALKTESKSSLGLSTPPAFGGRALGSSEVTGDKTKSSQDLAARTLFSSEVADEENGGPKARTLLTLLELIGFSSSQRECSTSEGVRGTCANPADCLRSGGSIVGRTCAAGYGTCCVRHFTCGQSVRSECAAFTNPGFPQPSKERLACTLTVHKTGQHIKQLRLDFVDMELQPPTNGTCVEDLFAISGQNVNSVAPILCGINSGQHVYVDVDESTGPVYVSILSAAAATRLFHVRICQLPAFEAPAGCLQYHAGTQGSVETFNYRSQALVSSSLRRQPGYFNNLNYAICIKRAAGACSITYYTDEADADPNKFQILNYDADGIPLIPPGQAGAEIFNCPDDFIVVNGIRLCGERLNDASLIEDFSLNAPVTEVGAGPIALLFRSNGNVTGRGFRLLYTQNPCAKKNN